MKFCRLKLSFISVQLNRVLRAVQTGKFQTSKFEISPEVRTSNFAAFDLEG